MSFSRLIAVVPLLVAAGLLISNSTGLGDSTKQERLIQVAKRWNSMSPERRVELRKRFSELQDLDPAERAHMRRLVQRLQSIERGMDLTLDESASKRLAGLDHDKRVKVLQEMVAAEASSEAQALLRRLPPAVRKSIQDLPPEERRALLAKTRRSRLDRILKAVSEYPERLGFSQREAARLFNLDKSARREALLLALKVRALKVLDAQKGSRKVGRRKRQRFEQLDPESFARAFMRYSQDHPGVLHDVIPGRAKVISVTVMLRRAIEPRAEEYLEFADDDPAMRRRKVQHRQRVRVMRVLRREHLLPPKRLVELEDAPDKEVLREATRLLAGRLRTKD